MNFVEYLKNRKKASLAAISGFIFFLKTEYSAWIHLLAIFIAITLGLVLQISHSEWISIFLLFAIVVTTEMLNTAIEHLCDFVQPEHDEKIGIIKDIAAGAVLFSAVISVVLAVLIFLR